MKESPIDVRVVYMLRLAVHNESNSNGCKKEKRESIIKLYGIKGS